MLTTPIDLYVFSGTGNTLLAAREIVRYFREQDVDIRLRRIEKSDPAAIDRERVLGLAFPVASQGTYPFVWEFIDNLPPVAGVGVFMLDTLAMYSGGVVGPLRRLLEAKGYRLLGAHEIMMPSNMFMVIKDEAKKQKRIEQGCKKARIFAHDLHYEQAKWGKGGLAANALHKVSRNEQTWQKAQQAINLSIDTSKCIQCGLCYKLCPIDNIHMYEFPELQGHCISCLRCINFCPVQAIASGSKIFKPYRAVKAQELLDPDPDGRNS